MRYFKLLLVAAMLQTPFAAWSKGKFDIGIGYFDFRASTDTATVKKSNLGIYELDYRYSLNSFLELGIGYTLLMTQTFGGDMAFGPNIEIIGYPLNLPHTVNFKTDSLSLTIKDSMKPYIGASFHQRQFESIQSSYAGFGFFAGTEYWYKEDLGLKLQIRSLSLSGPQNSQAQQVDVTTCYIIEF